MQNCRLTCYYHKNNIYFSSLFTLKNKIKKTILKRDYQLEERELLKYVYVSTKTENVNYVYLGHKNLQFCIH